MLNLVSSRSMKTKAYNIHNFGNFAISDGIEPEMLLFRSILQDAQTSCELCYSPLQENNKVEDSYKN